jgi:deoxyribodipyrimidine photo-lyase
MGGTALVPDVSASPTILWFRLDLRLADNAALAAALRRGGAVVPVYILDDAGEGRWRPGGASRWWLRHSLAAIDAALRKRGSRLMLRRGESYAVLHALVRETGAGAVYWNRRYEPASIERDAKVEAELVATGIEAKSFNSALLFEPQSIANKQGSAFQVFTPFWRHCLAQPVPDEIDVPGGCLPTPGHWPRSFTLTELGLRSVASWDTRWREAWMPGEAGALKRLRSFLTRHLTDYDQRREMPGMVGTSLLSPHLHFGEIGPRQIWAAVRTLSEESGVFPASRGALRFLTEVGWREFAYHLLYHFPHTPEQPLRRDFSRFPWAEDAAGAKLFAWQRGRTGYPIVDAGMRQLWATGWMHNRVRMIAASFLVKHLRLAWTHGAAWFWDTLFDADLASNTLGWQWSAGCGADAAPYFRIFNPVLQGRKFDANGEYVRRWVPELAQLPAEYIHRPWEAPESELARAGVTLGATYPRPVVDHAAARREALAAWQAMRTRNAETPA